ncbi:hypothetical protein [Paracoccus sp. (in: a-proteobacteria)]|uniref:hypothetical protein n=1 Tax=Paracoccus sp. TaxID=267 RepID=UPI0026E10B90|nr:hypothetical protein [Paracoccus sp. (in: a-proteobacteria)]MDO5369558.1 hypothetical protein [Paracoccus sp. (in: a-proteobacteria)]
MPLPHFLMLVLAVIVAAGVTLVVAVSLGIPLQVLALGTVIAAAVAHLSARIGNGPRHTPDA